MRRILLCAFLALALDTSAQSYSQRWKTMVDEHYRMVAREPGRSYEHRLIKAHNEFWRDVFNKCQGPALRGGLTRFDAIAILDAKGLVTAFPTKPDSPHLKCFRDEMVGKQYPKPPVAPFYELIGVGLSDN